MNKRVIKPLHFWEGDEEIVVQPYMLTDDKVLVEYPDGHTVVIPKTQLDKATVRTYV